MLSDDMAAVVISPTAGVTPGLFRTEQLELSTRELEGPIARRFLEACGLPEQEVEDAERDARLLAERFGGVVLHVVFGNRLRVEVLPRNVESIEAASRRVTRRNSCNAADHGVAGCPRSRSARRRASSTVCASREELAATVRGRPAGRRGSRIPQTSSTGTSSCGSRSWIEAISGALRSRSVSGISRWKASDPDARPVVRERRSVGVHHHRVGVAPVHAAGHRLHEQVAAEREDLAESLGAELAQERRQEARQLPRPGVHQDHARAGARGARAGRRGRSGRPSHGRSARRRCRSSASITASAFATCAPASSGQLGGLSERPKPMWSKATQRWPVALSSATGRRQSSSRWIAVRRTGAARPSAVPRRRSAASARRVRSAARTGRCHRSHRRAGGHLRSVYTNRVGSARHVHRHRASSHRLHGGRLVAKRLKAHGVSKLFTLSGGHLFSIYDGCREEGIDIVDIRHEQSAAFAAEGWAKATRKPGVAALTAGPGVTNGMSAWARRCRTARRCSCSAAGRRRCAGARARSRRSTTCPSSRRVTKLARTADATADIPG